MSVTTAALVLVAAPCALFALLILMGWLEGRLVAPQERAERVHRMLQDAHDPQEVERVVAGLAEQAMWPFAADRQPAEAPAAAHAEKTSTAPSPDPGHDGSDGALSPWPSPSAGTGRAML